MNWTLIKEKYPKAFKKLTAWYWGDMDFELLENGTLYFEQVFDGGKSYATSTLSFKDVVRGRKLYDFFDEQGIVIGIEVLYYDGFWFTPTITVMWDTDTNMKIGSQSRTEAEEQAFLKAFEILEDKL